MPVIDFTQPFYLLSALLLFILCVFLAKKNKTNTLPCIMLFGFLTILVCHTIEISYSGGNANLVSLLARNVMVDEAFTLVSYLSFLWLDRIQIEDRKKHKKKNLSEIRKFENRTFEDGLDFLWRQV